MVEVGQQFYDVNMNVNKFIIKYSPDRDFIKQFSKFCVVGIVAAVIHFSFLHSLTEWFGIYYVTSALVGGFFSAFWNFLANKFWTFKNLENGKETFKQAVKFLLVIGIGVVLNTFIIYLLTEFTGLDYRLSWIFATGIVLFWNFGLNRIWTFGQQDLDIS